MPTTSSTASSRRCFTTRAGARQEGAGKELKAGFTYQKTLNAKLGGAQHVTTKITEFEPPRLYAASITSSRGVNTVRYEIEPIEGQDAISVVYEEGYEGDKTLNDLNGNSWVLCTAPLPSVKSRSVCVTWRPTSRRAALPSETTSPIRYPPTANCRRRAKVRLTTPRRARNNMEDMNKIEMACFEIIANVAPPAAASSSHRLAGEARSTRPRPVSPRASSSSWSVTLSTAK